MKKNIFLLILMCVFFASCDDLFDPAIENQRDLNDMYTEPGYALGILANAYTRIPTNSWSFNDVATDDAVSNNTSNDYLKMATGQYTSNINPTERWRNGFAAIQYLNIFLDNVKDVSWANDAEVANLFVDRLTGEAYGLRGLFMYYLLQAHAGWSNGQLLGVPIITKPLVTESDFNLPRETFQKCMEQIYADLDSAEAKLPLEYVEVTNTANIPTKYSGISLAKYNRVFGDEFKGLINRKIVMTLRAQVALLAASPAYSAGNSTTWEDVANYAAKVIDANGGIGGIVANGYKWYANTTETDNLKEGENPAEIIWRTGYSASSSLEEDNYPPTLYGNGRVNPTQNLVDAFPMANGYPISDATNSGYIATTPYVGRDPRLAEYIIYNGSTAGSSSATINISDGSGNDAVNQTEKSTRTGYYLRKLLRKDVSYNSSSSSWNTQKHYVARMRYTEVYLIYAEAANQAYNSPDGTGSHAYSARDVIKAIRHRAGVGGTDDPYLASISSTDAMKTLIRNERRIELCFEGQRFWDLRRWKENLDETARGITISNGVINGTVVETRKYDNSYMHYGPIPYSEMLKWSNLSQNDGWR